MSSRIKREILRKNTSELAVNVTKTLIRSQFIFKYSERIEEAENLKEMQNENQRQ